MKTRRFKTNVRKLKGLGLTESLKFGTDYRRGVKACSNESNRETEQATEADSIQWEELPMTPARRWARPRQRSRCSQPAGGLFFHRNWCWSGTGPYTTMLAESAFHVLTC